MKLNPNYFVPKTSHVCMFCDTPLAKLNGDRLDSLGNKAHVLFKKSTPGAYIINCCVECAKRVDFADQAVLDQVHENVVKCMKSLNISTSVESPKVCKHIIERDSSKRKESLLNLFSERT
jgi:hypothetical protein